ncbi:MAG: C40 family peptidase [Betaproteobacteria bacterium]
MIRAPRLRRLALGLALTAGLSAAVAQTQADEPLPPPVLESSPSLSLPLLPATLLEQVASELLGVRYRFGGNDPSGGVDCSGLVRLMWSRLGLADLPRTAAAMALLGQPVALDALLPGDLVFFNTRGRRYSHVGVYVGEGRFVHASPRQRKVTESQVGDSYFRQRFNGARRLVSVRLDDPVTAQAQRGRWLLAPTLRVKLFL